MRAGERRRAVPSPSQPSSHPASHPLLPSFLPGSIRLSVPSSPGLPPSWQLACWAAHTYPGIRGFTDTIDQTSTSFSQEMNVKRVVIFMLVCADNLWGVSPPSFSVSEYVHMQGVSVMVRSQRKWAGLAARRFLNYMFTESNELLRLSVWLLYDAFCSMSFGHGTVIYRLELILHKNTYRIDGYWTNPCTCWGFLFVGVHVINIEVYVVI